MLACPAPLRTRQRTRSRFRPVRERALQETSTRPRAKAREDVRSNVEPAHVPEPPELHLAGGTEGRAGLQRRRPAGAHVRFDVGSVEAAHDVPAERRVTPEGVVGRFRVCFLHFGPGPVLAPRGGLKRLADVFSVDATVASLARKYGWFCMVHVWYGMYTPESICTANEC